MNGIITLTTALLDLSHELSGTDLRLIVGGGFGIYLKYRDLLKNTYYGFAGNFAGLRIAWMPASVVSCAGCFASYFLSGGAAIWRAVSMALMITAFLPALIILPNCIRQKPGHYAESS